MAFVARWDWLFFDGLSDENRSDGFLTGRMFL